MRTNERTSPQHTTNKKKNMNHSMLNNEMSLFHWSLDSLLFFIYFSYDSRSFIRSRFFFFVLVFVVVVIVILSHVSYVYLSSEFGQFPLFQIQYHILTNSNFKMVFHVFAIPISVSKRKQLT